MSGLRKSKYDCYAKDTFEFFVGKVEVDGGEHLTELLGSNFLVVVTVPVLEEGLKVQSENLDFLKKFHLKLIKFYFT